MICELAGRGFHGRAALACLVGLAVVTLFGHWPPAVASATASRIFPQVEPVHMSMREFLNAAIRLDPYCAAASRRPLRNSNSERGVVLAPCCGFSGITINT